MSRAQKNLRKLDKQVAREVRKQLDRVAALDDPTHGLKPLTVPLAGHFRLQVFKDW
ncbi:type II toxin-antitoxin system RelE family toxin [Nesterenkonia ebinurensis]|uniref:type II toxin-antitoxin system RelE family toxin n=1 Tax=Nesterenkonia ebinurensis TaxID=2608252 RepID=UPI00168A7C92|nr:hypothetical protein [Nesterenkonia ebinurensis]